MRRFAVLLASLLLTQPVLADNAWTWFALAPDTVETGVEIDAPFAGMFYSRTARYEAEATLLDAYVEDSKDDSLNVIAAGTELFLVHTRSSQYYCSTVTLLKDVNVVRQAEILRAALMPPFMNRTILPRDKNWQCFEDENRDMRFETVAGGELGRLAGIAAVQKVGSDDSIKLPLRYAMVEPSVMAVKMEVGLTGIVLDKDKRLYRISICAKAPDGTALACDKSSHSTIDQSRKYPFDLHFMDGIITIVAITAGDSDEPHVRYRIKRAPAATLVEQRVHLLYPAGLECSLLYSLPDKKK